MLEIVHKPRLNCWIELLDLIHSYNLHPELVTGLLTVSMQLRLLHATIGRRDPWATSKEFGCNIVCYKLHLLVHCMFAHVAQIK